MNRGSDDSKSTSDEIGKCVFSESMRVSFARTGVPAGHHTIALEAGGMRREGRAHVKPGGWAVAPLMSLR